NPFNQRRENIIEKPLKRIDGGAGEIVRRSVPLVKKELAVERGAAQQGDNFLAPLFVTWMIFCQLQRPQSPHIDTQRHIQFAGVAVEMSLILKVGEHICTNRIATPAQQVKSDSRVVQIGQTQVRRKADP